MPNIDFPDFAAIDQFVNQAKAPLFARTGGTARVLPLDYPKALRCLQTNAVIAALMQMPEIQELFRTTHERLYRALGMWDQEFAACGEEKSATWAATYSAWMLGFVKPSD